MTSSKWQVAGVALLAIVLFLLVATAVPALAQDGGSENEAVPTRVVTDDDVNKIARVVYCPVCESTPLDVCQTQACADWRQIIREMLEEGKSEQDVFDYFSNLYGDRVLAEPPREGFSLLIWLVPLIMVPLGLIFFGSYMRNLRASAGPSEAVEANEDTAVPESTAPDDYISQIEKELQQK